jgi:8-oxo-dGTP diphosphatase
MTAYRKGTSADGEMTVIRQSVARAGAAILSDPDPEQAFRDATDLVDLMQRLGAEAGGFRAQLAADRLDANMLTLDQLAVILGVSKSRAAQLVAAGRKRGTTLTDPGTETEPPAVAAAIIVNGRQVLIEHRIDGRPPWTFPAAEIMPGESPAAAILRRVPDETGLPVAVDHVIGRRIHPSTGRVMIYLQARTMAPDAELVLGAREDLDAVQWADAEETRDLMPDMFPPVRAYLDGLFQA